MNFDKTLIGANNSLPNIIAFGQDYMSLEDVKRRTDIFLESAFLEGYHCTRIEQLKRLEEGKKIYQTPRMNG